MWNGMHFQPDKGREVVRIFHEHAHFTNILCWDTRKAYRPSNSTENSSELDPRLNHKYVVPSGRGGRGRGQAPPALRSMRSITNWRDTEKKDDATPTTTKNTPPWRVGNNPPWRQQRAAPSDDNSHTPTQSRPGFMRRDHIPPPLKLDSFANSASPSPSPQPGQMFIADANGQLVPIEPNSALSNPASTPRASVTAGSTPRERVDSFAPHATTPTANRSDSTRSIWARGNGSASMRGSFAPGMTHPSLQHQSSLPQLSGENIYQPPQVRHALRHSKTSQDLSTQHKAAPSDASGSTALLREATNGHYYQLEEDQAKPVMPTNYTQPGTKHNVDPVSISPYLVAHHAHGQNRKVTSYETLRQGSLNNTDGSASSTLYDDWASTSEVERMRIAPLSPLSGATDPFNVDSVSKCASPSSKAFSAAVNRDLRTMRQGQRAMPTPPLRQMGSHMWNSEPAHVQQPSMATNHISSSMSAVSDHNNHGGVSLAHFNEPDAVLNTPSRAPSRQTYAQKAEVTNSATTHAFGQAPRHGPGATLRSVQPTPTGIHSANKPHFSEMPPEQPYQTIQDVYGFTYYIDGGQQ